MANHAAKLAGLQFVPCLLSNYSNEQAALSAAHGKILVGVKYEDQYAFAYDAISKSWSVHVMDKMIKIALEKNPA